MGNLLAERSIDSAIDGIEMSNHDKAAAKAYMREAEVIADCISSAQNGLSWLGHRLAKLVRSSRAPASRRAH